jgi:hypothetical protein
MIRTPPAPEEIELAAFNLRTDWPMITPAERAILDRIIRHPKAYLWRDYFGRRIPLNTHRYYLAHSPLGKAAVLRLKNREELTEWQTRKWTNADLFPDPPPTIVDVTLRVLTAIESSLSLSITEFCVAKVWVSVEQDCLFIFDSTGSAAPPTGVQRLHVHGSLRRVLMPELAAA